MQYYSYFADLYDQKYKYDWNLTSVANLAYTDSVSSSTSLTVEHSLFSELNYLYKATERRSMPYNYYYLYEGSFSWIEKAHGAVIQSDSLTIPILFYNNTFRETRFNGRFYRLEQFSHDLLHFDAESKSLYKIYYGFKTETLLYIFNHTLSPVSLIGNRFEHNGGFKGIVVISLNAELPGAFSLILNNLFSHNSGLVRASALHLTSHFFNSTYEASLVPGVSNFCGGFLVANNTFQYNSVYSTGGIVKVSCFHFLFSTEKYIMFEDI